MSEPTATRRQIPFWLTVSLMVNMLLLGLMLGLALRAKDKREDARPHSFMARSLPEEDRQVLLGFMRESFRDTSEQREARHAVRQELTEALRREPFDEEAVRSAFGKLRDADEAVHAATHEVLIDHLRTLPPERRERMAVLLARRPDGRRGSHRFRKPEAEE